MRRVVLKIGITVALLTLTGAISAVEAVERCVLVELFTFVYCGPCPAAEAALDSLTQEYPDSALAIIRYHPQTWPSNPFFQAEGHFRWKYYYGQTNFPRAYFDGGMLVASSFEDTTYDVYKDSIEVRRAIPSPLSVDLSVYYDSTGRTGQAQTEVVAVDPVAAGDFRLRYALIESGLEHDGNYHAEVFRDMLPDTVGVSFSISQGDTFEHHQTFAVDSAWVTENCALVVFVQDDATKEVLQSAQRTNSEWIDQPPVPAAIADIQAVKSGSHVYLSWSAVTEDWYGNPLSVDYYRIYGEASPYIETGTKTLIDSTVELFHLEGTCGHVGDLSLNCSYYVTAVAGGLESDPSNVVGELDHETWNVK